MPVSPLITLRMAWGLSSTPRAALPPSSSRSIGPHQPAFQCPWRGVRAAACSLCVALPGATPLGGSITGEAVAQREEVAESNAEARDEACARHHARYSEEEQECALQPYCLMSEVRLLRHPWPCVRIGCPLAVAAMVWQWL